MSGIYGYSQTVASENEDLHILGGLEYWNRIYGREAHGQMQFNLAGIGCHVEHFSNQFTHAAPVQENKGRYAVVDALIYNRDELLPQLGLDLDSTIPDEELLLQWIDIKGWKALEMVNGDFAGAIYDSNAGEWTIFRDHLGMRPLYLYQDSGFFAFSTDIRGLLAQSRVDAAPNEMRLYKLFIFQYPLKSLETEFAHIRFAQPGTVTRIKKRKSGFQMSSQTYWKLHRKKVRLESDEAYQRELRRLITDSVKRRLDAFPGLIGAELSGGLDSGVIDILINRMGREARFVSWSAAPEVLPLRDGADERHVINDICSQEGISCIYMRSTDRLDSASMLARVVPQNFDTPTLGWGSRLLRKQGIRVVFTGHGGDEGVSHRCNRLEPLLYGEFLSLYKLYLNDLNGISMRHIKAFKSIFLDMRRLWKKVYHPATREELNDPLFNAEFRNRMKARYRHKYLTFAFYPIQYVIDGGTQHRVDNAAYQGALHDVRYVYPYLDYRVLDYAVSIPRVQFLGKQNRRIFREAFKDILPESLYYLDYKDIASNRDLKRKDDYQNTFKHRLDRVLELLDHDIWNKYLNLEYISKLQAVEEEGSDEDLRMDKRYDYLQQLILMQNAREKALKWRELDEQGLLL